MIISLYGTEVVALDKLSLEGQLPHPNKLPIGYLMHASTAHQTGPQSPQEKLEKFFDNRPSTTELKQRNILRDSKVAPALQSAEVSLAYSKLTEAELERKRLEDELAVKLSIRPTADELVDQHILNRLFFKGI